VYSCSVKGGHNHTHQLFRSGSGEVLAWTWLTCSFSFFCIAWRIGSLSSSYGSATLLFRGSRLHPSSRHVLLGLDRQARSPGHVYKGVLMGGCRRDEVRVKECTIYCYPVHLCDKEITYLLFVRAESGCSAKTSLDHDD